MEAAQIQFQNPNEHNKVNPLLIFFTKVDALAVPVAFILLLGICKTSKLLNVIDGVVMLCDYC